MAKAQKPQKQWGYSPRKKAPAPVPIALKRDVEEKAKTLIETVLKPRYVLEQPEEPQFNYIKDLYTKWHRNFFYFCAQYKSAGPYALGGHFETKFARMRYAGSANFDLAFMRYTGEWIELYPGLTLDACLDIIRDDAWFQP